MATKLTSMARPKDGHPGSNMALACCHEDSGPKYGYGLILRLENFELDALKMRRMPAVGSQVKIEAVGVVEGVHESQSRHNEGDRSVNIQITDLAISAGSST